MLYLRQHPCRKNYPLSLTAYFFQRLYTGFNVVALIFLGLDRPKVGSDLLSIALYIRYTGYIIRLYFYGSLGTYPDGPGAFRFLRRQFAYLTCNLSGDLLRNRLVQVHLLFLRCLLRGPQQSVFKSEPRLPYIA